MTGPDCAYPTLSHFLRFFKGVRGYSAMGEQHAILSGKVPRLQATERSLWQCSSYFAGNRYTLSEVESHQPLPEHQQVSSGSALRRSERTFPESPRLNASARCFAV